MEIKGFSQCIAANKQQACGLATAASCGMVFHMQINFAALSCSNLVALSCSNLYCLWLSLAATLQLIVCCNLAACAFFECKLDFSLLVAACLLQTAAACLLQTAASCN